MDRTWNPTALSITCKDAFFSTRILYTDRPSQLAKHCSNLENNMNCAFEGPVDRFRGPMAEGVVVNRSGQGIQQERQTSRPGKRSSLHKPSRSAVRTLYELRK